MSPRNASASSQAGTPSHPSWLSLDNSAKIWPSVLSNRYTTLFRLTVCLDHPIRLALLQQALAEVMTRFPYFNVQIHRGFFWYHLVHSRESPPVEADAANPCMRAHLIGRGRWPFRVRVFNHRISVEFSHMITDGTGALNFLRALTVRYFELSGLAVSALDGLPRVGESPDPREWEDSHLESVVENRVRLPKIRPEEDAFRLPNRLLESGLYRIVSGYLSAAELLALAKARGLSLTEYLASVLLWCLQALQERADLEREAHGQRRRTRPIRLNVPVSLRSLFKSQTMRNFFSYTDPGIDPRLGLYSFEEISAQVRNHMRFQIEEKRMRLMISRNVRGEQPLLTRLIPLKLKDIVLGMIYRFLGDRRFSTSLSNLGRVSLPAELNGKVGAWVFIPPPSPISKVNCTVISWQDRLCISFGSMVADRSLETEFFRYFSNQGLQVYLESNDTRESEA